MKQKSLFAVPYLEPLGLGILRAESKKAARCKDCSRSLTRTSVLCGQGKWDRPLIFFLGESPTVQDDHEGTMLGGPSGELVLRMLRSIGLSFDDTYHCLAVMCGGPIFLRPTGEEIEACTPKWKKQIETVKPHVIVPFGAMVTSLLLNIHSEMNVLRGKWYEYEGIKVRPMYHPTHLMTYPETKVEAYEDLKAIRSYLEETGCMKGRVL